MEEKLVTIDNLESMLQKFFDGDTTCAEEKALERYFCQGGEVPPQFECYREMFGWYASGMDESALPKTEITAEAPHSAPRRPRILLWWGSVVAAIAVVIGLGWNHRVEQLEQPSLYAGSFVIRDGKMITGDEEIKGDIEATLAEGQCLDEEIDLQIDMLNSENKFDGI